MEPTDWVSSLVYARKQSGKLRICLDPRDLNKAIKRPHYPTKTIEDISYKLRGAKIFSKLDARQGYWAINIDHESSLKTTFNYTVHIQQTTIRLVSKPGCVPAEDGYDY